MFKTIYLIFGVAVILLYMIFSWLGWELFNAGSRAYVRSPFVWIGGGYRGK